MPGGGAAFLKYSASACCVAAAMSLEYCLLEYATSPAGREAFKRALSRSSAPPLGLGRGLGPAWGTSASEAPEVAPGPGERPADARGAALPVAGALAAGLAVFALPAVGGG